jgi:transcriptional repressor NrdR
MRCPHCGEAESKVIDTTHETVAGGVRRRRECLKCGRRFSTVERVVLATPLVVKSDGRREPFDRHKLAAGIRLACAKRPIPSESLDGLVDRIEARIQATGKAEVAAKMIGDLVIAGLKDIDQVAYIRYAIVYLGLADVESVRREIDRILER